MPELPEVQAHAERLTEQFSGAVLTRFVPFNFTALKTAVPRPEDAYGSRLQRVHRRGKYLLLDFGDIHFVIHLMQGGRLLVDAQQSAKPRNGQARFVFESEAMPALLLTEAGKERRAGVWCVRTADLDGPRRRRRRRGRIGRCRRGRERIGLGRSAMHGAGQPNKNTALRHGGTMLDNAGRAADVTPCR